MQQSSKHDHLKPSLLLLYIIAFTFGLEWNALPGLSNILTSADQSKISFQAYGALGLLLTIGAIFASFIGGTFGQHSGIFKILKLSLLSSFLSQTLIFIFYFTQLQSSYFFIALGVFLTGCAISMGLLALNTYILHFVPNKKSTAIVCMYASISFGSSLAPNAINLFLNIGWGWYFIILSLLYLFLYFLVGNLSLFKKLDISNEERLSYEKILKLVRFFPKSFWIYLVIAFVYPVYEALYGIWGGVYLHSVKGAPVYLANIGISFFWISIAIGQMFFAFLYLFISSKKFFVFFPLAMSIALILVYLSKTSTQAIYGFAFSGFVAASYFPLVFKFAEEKYPQIAAIVFGGIWGCGFISLGISSLMIGIFKEQNKMTLETIFLSTIIFTLILLFLSILLIRNLNQYKKNA